MEMNIVQHKQILTNSLIKVSDSLKESLRGDSVYALSLAKQLLCGSEDKLVKDRYRSVSKDIQVTNAHIYNIKRFINRIEHFVFIPAELISLMNQGSNKELIRYALERAISRMENNVLKHRRLGLSPIRGVDDVISYTQEALSLLQPVGDDL